MNPTTGRQLLIASFLAAVAMATWSEVKDYKRVPQPARYVGAGVVYGLLGLAAPFISFELAGLFGVGLFLTLLYQHYKHPAAEAVGNEALNAVATTKGQQAGEAVGSFLNNH